MPRLVIEADVAGQHMVAVTAPTTEDAQGIIIPLTTDTQATTQDILIRDITVDIGAIVIIGITIIVGQKIVIMIINFFVEFEKKALSIFRAFFISISRFLRI